MQTKRSIGILGGSFDPPHLGHTKLALEALANAGIDELWVLPCASHAFQKPLTSFADRMAMCQLAFGQLKNTRVSDLEQSLPAPNYTINTLEAIHAQNPGAELIFIMGSDLLDSFDKWHESDRIKKIARLFVVDRSRLLPAAQSTKIRKGDFLNLDEQVMTYIHEHALYST